MDDDLPFFPVVQSGALICRLWCVSLPYAHPFQHATSVRVFNNTSFFEGSYYAQTVLCPDQKHQKTCNQKNVPNAETVQCCLVCKQQPLSFAANIPNRCRWLECRGNSN